MTGVLPAELFVMVRDDARVWRLKARTGRFLWLVRPDAEIEWGVSKDKCRVGTARDWQNSRRFSQAWREGGGEMLAERRACS